MADDGRMILVVEGNTPEVLARAAAVGAPPAANTFAATLRRLDPTLKIAVAEPYADRFDAGAAPLDQVAGVALTGSGVSWGADGKEAKPYLAFLDRIFAAGAPVFGSCWGMQTACVLLGGRVRENPKGRERGVARDVRLTDGGRAHAMFAEKPSAFDTVCIHRDEVHALPSGANWLAENEMSAIQAMAFEEGDVRFWGAQYHPELSLSDVAHYLMRPGENVLGDPDPETRALADALSAADRGDQAAAEKLGATPDATAFERRSLELKNWLASLPAA